MKIQKNVDKIYRNKCNEWRSERKRKQKAGIILIAVFLLLCGAGSWYREWGRENTGIPDAGEQQDRKWGMFFRCHSKCG